MKTYMVELKRTESIVEYFEANSKEEAIAKAFEGILDFEKPLYELSYCFEESE